MNDRVSSVLGRLVRVLLLALVGFAAPAPGLARAETLPTVAQILDGTPFSPKDARTVVGGEIAVTPVDGISDRELAVGLACLIPESRDASKPFQPERPMLPSALIDDFRPIDPENAEVELRKLAFLEAEGDELRRFIEFEPGLGLNLSAEEVERFRELGASHDGAPSDAQIHTEVDRMVADRVRSYHARGLDGIAPYLREKDQTAQPGEELRRALAQAHTVERRYPRFFQFWNRYPEADLPGVDQRYFAIKSIIRDRPALLLAHQASWTRGDSWMVGERHYYVSHFFNGGYTVAFVVPVQEGRLFAMMERLWVDGYSGMSGLKMKVGRRLLAKRLRDEVLHRNACRNE